MAILIAQEQLRALLTQAYEEGWQDGGQVSLATALEERLPPLLDELMAQALNGDQRNVE